VVVPLTLLQYLFGDWLRTRGEVTSYQQISTATWAVGAAGLVAALAGILMYLVLTGAITRAVAAEVVGEDPAPPRRVARSVAAGSRRPGARQNDPRDSKAGQEGTSAAAIVTRASAAPTGSTAPGPGGALEVLDRRPGTRVVGALGDRQLRRR